MYDNVTFITDVQGNSKWESIVDILQKESLQEGNDSIHPDKFNVRETQGKTILFLVDGMPAGMSHMEPSHYTGDPDIAVRGCRYHILKKFRNRQLGFPLLDINIKLGRELGYKIFYITRWTEDKAVNALYQHRRKVPGHNPDPYNTESYKSLTLDKRCLFIVDPNAPHYQQYIYYVTLEEGFVWKPKKSVIWQKHDGQL
jgi:hypothetical protein